MTDPHSPAWREAAQLPQPLTPLQHDWLFGEDSLTRRLITLSRQTFSVQPLDQGWQVLRDDECQALGVPPGSVGWVRQVYLCGRGRPWVFARSVAARTDLQAAAFDLSRLGERSLGELLFSELAFTRGPFEVCHYPAAALPPAVAAEQLWARRSRFARDALGVLVAEVFLPAFWAEAHG